jgi:hypothetical protein
MIGIVGIKDVVPHGLNESSESEGVPFLMLVECGAELRLMSGLKVENERPEE